MSLFHNLLAGAGLTAPPKPPLANSMFWSGTSHARANMSARQTALEPTSSAGVDKPYTWSFWIRPANTKPDTNRILIDGPLVSNTFSYIITINPLSAQTASGVLAITLQTSTGNSIGRYTSAPLRKGRVSHVAITYTGSEVNTGIKIYINGTEDTSAVLTSAGTYTGLLNDSNARIQFGSVNSSTSSFGGDLKEFCFWNKALSAGEVTTLYNAGIPIAASSVGFYSDIIAYYPMATDLTCANNAALNVSTSTNVATRSTNFGVSYESLTMFNAYPANSAYTAFGGLIQNGAQTQWYGRSGTTHLANGNIVKHVFNQSTFLTGGPTTVIDDATYDLRGGSVGILNSNQILFFTAKFTGPSTFIELDRYESTDGLTGQTFGAAIPMATTLGGYVFYGKMIEGYIAGEYWVPEYEAVAATSYNVYVWHYSGGVWTKNTVWTGSPGNAYGEPAILKAGNGTFLLVLRSETVAGLHLSISTNGGSTWSTPTAMNVGAGICNADMCLDPYGRIVLVYMDRSTGRLLVSAENKLSTIVANPTAWNVASTVFQSYPTDSLSILGYPSIIRQGWYYTIALSAEFSSSRADLIMGYGRLD